MSKNEDALRCCPFCGSAPKTMARPDNIDGTEFFAAVFCHCDGYSATAHCGARRPTQSEAEAAARAAWNRRPENEAQAALLRQAVEALDRLVSHPVGHKTLIAAESVDAAIAAIRQHLEGK